MMVNSCLLMSFDPSSVGNRRRWLLEWLDEGDAFRTEAEYARLLAPHFAIVHREEIVDQFYRTLVLRCRKA